MSEARPIIPAERIVVILPTWLGDAVMATPFLRGLRGLYPGAQITAVARPLAAAAVSADATPGERPLVDRVLLCAKRQEAALARQLRGEKYDLGILLPNSFRSAWMLFRAGVKRRVGYARGGRGWLLTDRLRAPRRTTRQLLLDEGKRAAQRVIEEALAETAEGALQAMPLVRMTRVRWIPFYFRADYAPGHVPGAGHLFIPSLRLMPEAGGFEPTPVIQYYLGLLKRLARDPAPLLERRQMALTVTAAEEAEAVAAMEELGIAAGERVALLVPGANFGASKCWLPERFAAVAERLADPAGPFALRVVVVGSPGEREICDAVMAAVGAQRERVGMLGRVNGGKGISVGALKAVVRRAALMICNDTGPRHIAAAFDVPLVTLFGPTDPVWAETFSPRERLVRIDVPCGPCQLKKCPIDHRCMRGITVEAVLAAAEQLYSEAVAQAGRDEKRA